MQENHVNRMHRKKEKMEKINKLAMNNGKKINTVE